MFKLISFMIGNRRLHKFFKNSGLVTIEIDSFNQNLMFNTILKFCSENEIKHSRRSFILSDEIGRTNLPFLIGNGFHLIRHKNLIFGMEYYQADDKRDSIIRIYTFAWDKEALEKLILSLVPPIMSQPRYRYLSEDNRRPNRSNNGTTIPQEFKTMQQYVRAEDYARIDKIFENFSKGRDNYIRVNKPYKESIFLYGPPGTAKTTLSTHMACKWGFDLMVVTSIKLLTNAIKHFDTPTVLLIDDIDSYSCLRIDGKAETEKVIMNRRHEVDDYSNFINYLGGAVRLDNVIIIMTSNFPEKILESVIRRGRVDHAIKMDRLSNTEIAEFVGGPFVKEIMECDKHLTISHIPDLKLAETLDDVKEILNHDYMDLINTTNITND